MGYITQEDFDLLEKWGRKPYNTVEWDDPGWCGTGLPYRNRKADKEHMAAREALNKIRNKIKYIGDGIHENDKTYRDEFKIAADVIVTMPGPADGPIKYFENYLYGRFYPRKDDKRLFLAIGVVHNGYVVKLGVDFGHLWGRRNLNLEEEKKYSKLREESKNGKGKKMEYFSASSAIVTLSKEELIDLTEKNLEKLEKEFDGMYNYIFGDSNDSK